MLKLKDFNDGHTTRQKPNKTVAEEVPGYISSLIHKVLNNISIICQNIVVKYIEDDSIMSCNIQYLSVHSCDMRFRKAFLDVSPTNVLFRKLINIIDLTICMDSRNSAGKIQYINHPVLYKCSMEIRLFRKCVT